MNRYNASVNASFAPVRTPATGWSRIARLIGAGQVLVSLAAFATVRLVAADEIKEISAPAAAVDKALEGKQTYNFVVISADEFADQEGRHFSPKAIKAYLDTARPEKKAAYIFWMRGPGDVEIVKTAVPEFDAYGAAMIVVREMGKEVTAPAKDSNVRMNVVLVGQPNPKSHSARDMMPEMLGRPVHLRPGPLPHRVRYQFKPDAEVVAAAECVQTVLLGGSAPVDASSIAGTLMVQPGVWSKVARLPVLKDAKLLHSQVQLRNRVTTLDGGVLNQPVQTLAVVNEVRAMISADRGGVRRALRSDEMNQWWTYIGFDIEEPVFVVETNGGHHRFIVACTGNQISLLDDI